ncbi:hypothetical protein QQF54_01665 [Lelliottia sp. V106_10]|uniref:hypothetical protein n=1 Tax=Lelliottia wanjuensis TaxID=3050585 RepID=UPI00254F25AC|nr:hypothetical protein [Lelliottia sp. V106_10]MDK9372060.1 hypothetical protein [Lelliottia sp. V106_10]
MHYYSTSVQYCQIINELQLSSLNLPVTRTSNFRLYVSAFASGFRAGWHRSWLPEHWLAQQLRLVASYALQRGSDLSDPAVYQWCLSELTAAWDPTTDGGRVLHHAGARTPAFDGMTSTPSQPGLPFAEALVTGLNTLRSTWRLVSRLS